MELHAARNAWKQQVTTLQAEHQLAVEAVRARQTSMQAAADAATAASAAQTAGNTDGMPLESEPISLPEPQPPVLPAPPAIDISRLTRHILDSLYVKRFSIGWDQESNVQVREATRGAWAGTPQAKQWAQASVLQLT